MQEKINKERKSKIKKELDDRKECGVVSVGFLFS